MEFTHFTVQEYFRSRIPSLDRDVTVDMFRRLLQLGNASTSLDTDTMKDYVYACCLLFNVGIRRRDIFVNMDSEMECLITQLLDPSLPHYDLLWYLSHGVPEFEYGVRPWNLFNGLLAYSTEESREDPATTYAIMVGNCLFLCLLPLAGKLLDDKGRHILEKEVNKKTVGVDERSDDVKIMIESVLESLSYSSLSRSRDSFVFLLDQFDIFCHAVDRRKTVGYYIIHHHEDHRGSNCQPECRLKKLLSLGASPDSSSLSLTPLQIAVLNRDLSAIKLLLQEGVNVSEKGKPDPLKDSWFYRYYEDIINGPRTPFKLDGFRHESPLVIALSMLRDCKVEEKPEFRTISSLLLEYTNFDSPFADEEPD